VCAASAIAGASAVAVADPKTRPATISAGTFEEDGEAQAHCPAQEDFVAVQPGPCVRLQHDFAFPEPQQDIPRANSCSTGAPWVAKTATSASTARMTRPLKVLPSYHAILPLHGHGERT
jgi:hypothetical protein